MRFTAFLLAIVLAFNETGSALQTAQPSAPSPAPEPLVKTPEQKRTDKIKADVMRRGVGEKSRVRVKLRDGMKLKGFITRIEEDSFEVETDPDGPDSPPAKDRRITVRYADVAKIRGPQSGIARIGTDVGLTIAVVAVLAGLALFALWDYNRRNRY